jgi:hypothetical protein
MEPDPDLVFVQRFNLAKEPLESYWNLQQLSDVVNIQGSLADADLSSDAEANFVAVGPPSLNLDAVLRRI